MISYLLAIFTGLFVVGFDQYTKYLIKTTMVLSDKKGFIPGLVEISFIENTGSAWGMLSGHTLLLVIFTAIVMILLVIFLLKAGKKNKLLFWAIILIMSGGLGNMIDRIFRGGRVVDFLQFEFYPSFPVFNVADCAIVVGAGFLMLYFIIDAIREKKNIKSERQETDGKD